MIPGPKGAPLLYAGTRDGLRTAVLAFEPRRSDLPLQVAFPILLANLTGELLGGSVSPTDAVAPGSPVTLAIPAGATGLRVERPDGSIDDLLPGTADSPTVVFSRTGLLGVYTVTPLRPDGEPPSPSLTPTPSPSGSPSASPTASASGEATAGTPAPVDADAPVRFAVDLFDIDESTIAPGSAAALEALGTSGSSSGATTDDRPPARDELWGPVLLVVLLLLLVEWMVYERDTLARLRRSATARLRTGGPAAAGPGRGGAA